MLNDFCLGAYIHAGPVFWLSSETKKSRRKTNPSWKVQFTSAYSLIHPPAAAACDLFSHPYVVLCQRIELEDQCVERRS